MCDTHSQEKKLLLFVVMTAAVTVAVGQWSCHSWYFGFQKNTTNTVLQCVMLTHKRRSWYFWYRRLDAADVAT